MTPTRDRSSVIPTQGQSTPTSALTGLTDDLPLSKRLHQNTRSITPAPPLPKPRSSAESGSEE